MLNFIRGQRAPSLLSDNVLFAGLSPRALRIVEGLTHARHYLPGEVIFDAGEEAEALYCVVSGEVLICRQGDAGQPLARLGAGAFFGELALLEDEPRAAQAVAGQETRLAVLFRGDFERLMESHGHIASRIAVQLARHLGRRLREMLQAGAGRQP